MKAKSINIDSNKQEIDDTIPGFPISCYYNKFTADTYDYIDWHWHIKFQLCLTTHGTVVWNTESHKTLIPTGEGIFINSQQVHMAKPFDKEAAFFCLDISPDFLCPEKEAPFYRKNIQPILEESCLDQKKITRQTPQGIEILSLLSQMTAAFELKSDGYEFDLLSGIFKLWKNLRIYLDSDIKNIPGPEDDRFKKMLLYLQENYSAEFNLDDIAGHIGLSRSECCRYFKKKSGQTISDYLRQYRIRKSLGLLTESDISISQIAQSCGFSNQSYYTKEFRRVTGTTPKQYRLQKEIAQAR